MTHGYVVYMVRCADGTYYTGSTNNLEARIKHHNTGHGAKYVRGRGPVTLVYVKGCRNHRDAAQAEWQLKQRSHQEKSALSRTSS